MKKSIFPILLSLFLNPFFCNTQTPVSQYGKLKVAGNKVLDKNNTAVSLAGMSLFWSNTNWGGEAFYTEAVVDWLIEDWNTTIIRAAMGVDDNGGYLNDPSNKERVKLIIDKAIEAGIYVIIDWHSHHAHDYESEAIDFFEEMAQTYGEHPNIIYEIYNEPMQISWSNTVKPYSESVIAAIRAIDPDNLIIVGSPTWSQDVDVVAQDPIEGYANIAYTLHFYAATHGQYLRDKAKVALDNGLALFVTEWGTVSANGDGAVDQTEVDAWMDFLCEHAISHCNWALNDKVEGASALKEGASTNGGWSANDLTVSGSLVKGIISDWCLSVDTEQVKPLNSIKVTPNPVESHLRINLQESQLFTRLEIIDLKGNVVQTIPINPELQDLNIEVDHLQSGLYLLRLLRDSGITVEKIIKL
jgi:endoglucanase